MSKHLEPTPPATPAAARGGQKAGPGREASRVAWQFWIDRGGTFTDCVALAPDGVVHSAKLLSSETAPVEAVRKILREAGGFGADDPLPADAVEVKLGTTVATNALLERRGAPTAVVTNSGLGDLFVIGTQQRPELFELAIEKPAPLHTRALELSGRLAADGSVLEALDIEAARRALGELRASGIESLAIVGIHATLDPAWEQQVAELAREAGFPLVVCSARASHEVGLLARGETAIADAYLTPLLSAHVKRLEEALPGARLRFMQSSGGLTDAARFRGSRALLSGPAGGAVGAARVASESGLDHQRAIGFDMGGTSTDVCLVVDGEAERCFESLVAGIRVRAPMLKIHTVAAGGGSLCRFDGFRLTVGPESAGANPGPICYGRPEANELALTDVNAFLGRIHPARFSFPLDIARVAGAFEPLLAQLSRAGLPRSAEQVAAGFVEIANAGMAEAIRQVSVARGVDPRDCALVGFGGAAGQHVCAVARRLGIGTVLLHPLAGLLSAYGIGVSEAAWDGERALGSNALRLADDGSAPAELEAHFVALAREGQRALAAEGVAAARQRVERRLDLRYRGAETALSVLRPTDDNWARAFGEAHQARFGYTRSGRAIEMVTLRVSVRGGMEAPRVRAAFETPATAFKQQQKPAPRRETVAWFPGTGRVPVPLVDREALQPGAELAGPAIVLESVGTVVIDPGFRAVVEENGLLRLRWATPAAEPGEPSPRRAAPAAQPEEPSPRPSPGGRGSGGPDGAHVIPPAPTGSGGDGRLPAAAWGGQQDGGGRTPADADADDGLESADPVRLEVFGNRFMSIAEQMGAVLRNTALSTNIKERLDYSCAVFDAEGGLVANAPHIPVHLGAMGATVRAVKRAIPDLRAGDAIVTNDPAAGGSHLPDVTVVSPIYYGRALRFFVASRGHHADLGGMTPGSMPAFSTTLEEEGVLLPPFPLRRDGVFFDAELRARLLGARYPARNPDDNLADLEALLAANQCGEALLRAMVDELGLDAVRVTMAQLQQAAAGKVAREIARLGEGTHFFADALDDGTPLEARLTVRGERLHVDFTGTGRARASNLNAPRAVVESAVLYVLRCLVAERIPLNGGCLLPVTIKIPEGSLLDPPPGVAVVGGNVETAQRIVDVLLGAIGRVAASQGTMNNITFGDESFGYYETVGGGAGAGDGFAGASGVHTHMTNTRITDPELLELRTPAIVRRFALRRGSGGSGRFPGGDGLLRELEFTQAVEVSLLTERRARAPYGLAGGGPGARGENRVLRRDGSVEVLPGRARATLEAGDRLRIETPGGGGYGRA